MDVEVESTPEQDGVARDAAAAANMSEVGKNDRFIGEFDGDDDDGEDVDRLPEAIAAAAARAEGGDGEGPNDGGSGRSWAANMAAA